VGFGFEISDCQECTDGHVCVFESSTNAQNFGPDSSAALEMQIMGCTDMGYAEMYALNGRSDLARYADRSAYTNAPLPTPSDCPSIAGLTLCGGACGDCATGYICVGRSPLHPYSLCVNDFTTHPAPPNVPTFCLRSDTNDCEDVNNPGALRCLTFKVDDASQPVADANSFCVDTAVCNAAAAAYPGGAYCTQ
jgi:hypothetical protein